MTETHPRPAREPRFAPAVLNALLDPALAESAANTLRQASGPTLDSLWGELLEPGLAAELTHALTAVLCTNPNPLPPETRLAVWQHCLRSPGSPAREALLELLLAQERPDSDATSLHDTLLEDADSAPTVGWLAAHEDPWISDLLCSAAVARPGPAADRIAALCAEHGLAPQAEDRRVEFFLLSGQVAQFRAADPDGSLLAASYRRAAEDHRRRLREAMASAGELDLVRVVLGEADEQVVFPTAAAHPHERGFLARSLAEQGEWDRLWRLTLEASLAEALDHITLYTDWSPASERDRALFDRLRRAAHDAVLPPTAAEPTILATPGPVHACALSPHGDRIAVLWRTSGASRQVTQLDEFDTRTGERLLRASQHEQRLGARPALVHLGESVLLTRALHDRSQGELLRYDTSGATSWYHGPAITRLLPTRDGYAGTTLNGRLLLGARDSAKIWPLSLDITGEGRRPRDAMFAVSSHPVSGLLAFGGDRLRVYSEDGRRLPVGATAEDRRPLLVAIAAPDLIVTAPRGKSTVTRWVRAAPDAEFVPAETADIGRTVHGLAALQPYGFVVHDVAQGRPALLNGSRLEQVDLPCASGRGEAFDAVACAPLGLETAVGGRDSVEVRRPLVDLAHRPRAELTGAEPGLLAYHRTNAPPGHEGFCALLDAWIAHGAEITLAEDPGLSPTASDIEIER